MSEHTPQIERIKAKLETVRDAQVGTFGSGSHRFELGPPLREPEVRAFEVEHGVTLPAGYRAFLTELGHSGPGQWGGVGPYHGLYGLDSWDEFLSWLAVDENDEWLRLPSPLRPGRNALPDVDEDDDDDSTDPELLAMFGGVLTLGTRGCTYFTGLVVSGEARGRVVYLDANLYEAPYVVRDADFLDWYERWLDERIAGYQGSWFGYGPAGGEDELLELVSTSDDDELRIEAINNLHHLPVISADAFLIVARRFESELPTERAAAAGVFISAPVQHVGRAAALLDDVDADVRRAACRALMKGDAATWSADVWRRLLSDSAESVRTDAFFALRNAQQLDTERLAQIASTESLGEMRAWAGELIEWTSEHEALLITWLDADHNNVRRLAATQLALLQLPGTVDAALERFPIEEDDIVRAALIRLFVALKEYRASETLLDRATGGDDFERLEAVRALVQLGDDRVQTTVVELLALDRPLRAPGRSLNKTFAELLRPTLDESPSPKLRALGKVV